MDIKEYQTIVAKTAVYPKEIGKLYCTLGLCGEAGEVAEKIKKFHRDSLIATPEWKAGLSKELGDVLWYITALATEYEFTLEDIMLENYNKLMKRRETNTLHGSGDNREEIMNVDTNFITNKNMGD